MKLKSQSSISQCLLEKGNPKRGFDTEAKDLAEMCFKIHLWMPAIVNSGQERLWVEFGLQGALSGGERNSTVPLPQHSVVSFGEYVPFVDD